MNGVEQDLDRHAVAYVRHEHEAVFTCKEADELRGSIKGMASKNLFLQNKKKTRFFLVIISSTKQIDLKKLAGAVHENQTSLKSPKVHELMSVPEAETVVNAWLLPVKTVAFAQLSLAGGGGGQPMDHVWLIVAVLPMKFSLSTKM